MEGLYAAGEVQGDLYGAIRLRGGFAKTQVIGKMAACAVAALERREIRISTEPVVIMRPSFVYNA